MKLLREEGRLKDYEIRSKRNESEIVDWEKYVQKSSDHASLVQQKRKDIMTILHEEWRKKREGLRMKEIKEKEEEEKRKKKIEEEGGEWIFYAEYGEYYRVGEKEPVPIQDAYVATPLTEQELIDDRHQEEVQLEAIRKEKKDEAREKRKDKKLRQKEAMEKPIPAVPKKELCEYEKIRNEIVQEREDAMAKSGFFDELKKYKKMIGLVKQNSYEILLWNKIYICSI